MRLTPSVAFLAFALAANQIQAQPRGIGESAQSADLKSQLNAAQVVNPLRRHLESARQYDPNYQAAFAVRDAAEQSVKFSQSNLGPKVTLSGSTFRTERTEESTNFLGQTTQTDRAFNSHLFQIQARQPIYRQRDRVALEQANTELEAARQGLLYAEQDLYSRLIGAWVNILTARDQITAYSNALTASKEVLIETEKSLLAGEITLQDVDQARARLAQAEAQIVDAQAQLDVAQQALKNIAGPDAQVPDRFELMRFLNLRINPLPVDKLFELIDTKNYEVANARFREAAALLEREKAQSDSRPTLDAYASMSRGENDNVSSVKDEQRIGLQLSVPLYTHGGIDAAVGQAEANYRRARAQARAVVLRVRADALAAQQNLRALSSRAMAADRAYEAIQVTLIGLRKGLVAGVNSRAEVARAVQELLAAQRQRLSLRQEYANAWTKFNLAVSGFGEDTLDIIYAQLN